MTFVAPSEQLLTLIFNLWLTCVQVNKLTMRTKVSIPETIRQDKGSYMLTAENCFGKALHTIHVEILGKKLLITSLVSLWLLSYTYCVVPDRPLPPRNITVSDIRADSCYLTWDAPEDNGGSEITNFIVERRDASKKKSDFEVQTVNLIDRRYGVSSNLMQQKLMTSDDDLLLTRVLLLLCSCRSTSST